MTTPARTTKLIADDPPKQLKVKVNVEIVTDYAALEKGLAARAYDLAFVHPTHIALAPVKRGEYTLAAVSKAHTGYKGVIPVEGECPGSHARRSRQDAVQRQQTGGLTGCQLRSLRVDQGDAS